MSDILIRPATLDDLEMILRLDRLLFLKATPSRWSSSMRMG